MQPFFWRPDPQPQQGVRNNTLPDSVGDNPPFRGGPLAAAVLAASVAAWPLGAQSTVPERDLSQTSRMQIAAIIPPPAPAVDQPPPRVVQFSIVPVGGVFYPQYLAIPERLPSGIPPNVTADDPPPHVPLPGQVLTSWHPAWAAQRARTIPPPEGEAPVAADQPFVRQPLAILHAWHDVSAVTLPMVGLPQDAPGDTPPARVVQPAAILRSWERDWRTQHAPTFDYSRLADEPTPRRPFPYQILTAWQVTWDTQYAPESASWDVPPQAAGDEVPVGRVLPPSVLRSWEPPFIAPPALPTLDMGRLGDDPPPYMPLPPQILRQWQQDWRAQHASPFHAGQLVPPPEIKGFIVRMYSGALYAVRFEGDQLYAVRIG